MNDIEQRLKRLEDAVLHKPNECQHMQVTQMNCNICGLQVRYKKAEEPKATKREEIVHILAGLLSTIKPMDKTHPQDCVPFAEAALDYLEGVLEGVGTKLPFPMLNDFGRGHRGAILDVRREVFGRES